MSVTRRSVFLISIAAGAWGCGASAPLAPEAQRPAPAVAIEKAAPVKRDMATTAEIGGLNEREAAQSFRDSMNGLEACIRDGVDRLDFIGGSIEFAVKVDASRHATSVWAAKSSLGERGTEKCMFDALRSVTWPAPQGGAFGIARNAFDFEPHKGAVPPAVWDAGRVAGVVSRLDDRLSQCRGDATSHLLITLYIGPGGRALSGGAASEDPVDETAVDCVVDALLEANYPAPEHAPTKVRFQL